MRNKGISCGSTPHVSKTGKWQGVFYDSAMRKSIHLGFFDSKLEAQNVVDDTVFDYYSTRNYLLPKGIALSKSERTFRYTLTIQNKTVHIGQAKRLKDILKIRLDFIAGLL